MADLVFATLVEKANVERGSFVVGSKAHPFSPYDSVSCTAANASGAIATLKIRGGLVAA